MKALTMKAPTTTETATMAITAISLMWLLGGVVVVESQAAAERRQRQSRPEQRHPDRPVRMCQLGAEPVPQARVPGAPCSGGLHFWHIQHSCVPARELGVSGGDACQGGAGRATFCLFCGDAGRSYI